MTYPLEFRRKVMEVKANHGLTYQQTADRFCIGKNTITRWHRCLEPKQCKDRPSIKLDILKLQHDVEQYPDAYQYERAERLNVSSSCVFYALRRLKISFKKRPSLTQKLIQQSKRNLLTS